MATETAIWIVSILFHLALLTLLIRHHLPRFTLLIAWQLVQVPVLYAAHHHDLNSWYYWELYRNIFIGLRIVDFFLALLAMNESICTEYHVIALGLEAWLGSQLLVLAVCENNPQYWSIGENVSNVIYLLSCVLWLKLLARGHHE